MDDIVQLAILRVVNVIDRDRSEGDPELATSYLWKVAYTTTIDELRKAQSRGRIRERAIEAQVGLPTGPRSPETAAEGAKVQTALRACLGHLNEDRRRAVVLHLQGHSVPQISSLLGWARKRAENLVYRGLAALRECLAGKGFGP